VATATVDPAQASPQMFRRPAWTSWALSRRPAWFPVPAAETHQGRL